MSRLLRLRGFRFALTAAITLGAWPILAQEQAAAPSATVTAPTLEAQFADPPQSARPRVWWHWMNGNITEDGIAKDLAWMKRTGIGGLQNFDVNLQTPQVVDRRLVYMTPEWKAAFRFAASEADRLGLELAIAASPGFSETGGPWVPPADGLKKLVWSETLVQGGKPFTGTLTVPPTITGPFQSIDKRKSLVGMMTGAAAKAVVTHYADSAIVAFPDASRAHSQQARVLGSDGKSIDTAALSDADFHSTISLARQTAGDSPSLTIAYAEPQTIRAVSLFVPQAWLMFLGPLIEARLEASENGIGWRKIVDIPVADVPATLSFDPVTATRFRLVVGNAKINANLHGTAAPGVASDTPFDQIQAMLAMRPIDVGDFRLFAESRIDQFETKAAFTLTPDYFALSPILAEAEGIAPASVIDLTSRLRADGSLDWTPPMGRWRVLRFGHSLIGTENHPAPPEATGLEVDKFDGPAVRRYLEHYIGMYRDAAGPDLVGARGVRAILTDSIEVGAANWTPRLIEQFGRLRGYDPTPWLPALTGHIVRDRAASDAFLFDFRRTLADLLASEHYGTIADVAHENGLKVYGEALESNRPSIGDDMAMRRHTDVPMAAMWSHTTQEGPKPTYLADLKGAASTAHIYGQNIVAAESLTSASWPWAHAPSGLKRVIDLAFVTGVNRPVIHTSVHQPLDEKMPGISMGQFGQHFTRHDTWAEMARPWMDYLARNALLLQQGRNVADVAYFYGEEGPLTGLYGDKAVADAPTAFAYDFVNADALGEALANDGTELTTPGGARYKALYLGGSSRRMSLATLRRIAALAEGGATVVGMRPEGSPSLAHDAGEYATLVGKLWPGGVSAGIGKGRVIASQSIEAALESISVAPDFRFSGGGEGAEIPFVHRKLSDGDSYFLVNRKDRPETIEARFRVTGKAPQLWHAATGTSEPLSYRIENGETVVPLNLAGEESVYVVFRSPAKADALAVRKVVHVEAARLDGPWQVAFQPGRGAPASTKLAQLAPLDESAEPGIRYFSGIATYTREFTAPKGWKRGQPLWLNLGEVRELAEVSVNGKPAGAVWHAPYRLDIGQAAKPGRNRIEVRVANLWVNRLIGDAQPGAAKITWTSQPTYRADAPLRRSGLIGPVVLEIAGR